ncbi:CDP-diacylglycerol--inositol 3-phosphatidyltransferase 1 [Citrus sinensis]|uniref:CDP-diacylglycerol--inositol 3-phosphatidyltransferase 1 n=1 Tax=Citrus sinensis TaxID=2711 RepID=A0ACB8HWM3_CITSI|nr:CDP-diacylglycerol--inositol 3-phosphatidyltransferase 1 [Citrus sinensis]
MANVKKTAPRLRKLSVYLYIPNIIGGFLWVFLIVYDYWLHGFDGIFHFYVVNVRYLSVMRVLGAFSFVCDAIDGWCARKFNQVSTFGAVLDMVTDRISTACLLVILSQVYRPGLVFVSLLALDIGSHWLQMYSTFLTGKTNHKDVKDSTNWLFKAYYGNRMFMGYCCVACEVIVAFRVIIHISTCKCYRYFLPDPTVSTLQVVASTVRQGSPLSFLVALSLFGWAIKQTINVIQETFVSAKLTFYNGIVDSEVDQFETHMLLYA